MPCGPIFLARTIETTVDAKIAPSDRRQHILDLAFPREEAKRLLVHAEAQIDEQIRLKQRLTDEIAISMKEANVSNAVAAEVRHVTRSRPSDVVNPKVEKSTVDALVSKLGRIGKQARLPVQQ